MGKKRPGTMVYWDIYTPVQMLPDAERGQLFTAMLEYGMDGKLPEFTGNLAIAWGFIKSKIDRDAVAYKDKSISGRYSVYCREARARGIKPIGREYWIEASDDDRDRWMAIATARYPSKAANASSVSTGVSATEDDYEDLRRAQIAKLDQWR